jgi:hypothetical protein
VLWLTGQSTRDTDNPQAILLAYVYFYDQRAGGIEIEIREDKQGLGATRLNKKHFEAQQMLIQFEALAHNVLVRARHCLNLHCPRIARLGLKRLCTMCIPYKNTRTIPVLFLFLS